MCLGEPGCRGYRKCLRVQATEGCLSSYNRVSGSGYPEGLKEEEIPLYARIISIADAYDALTTDRPYKKAVDKDAALEEIAKDKSLRFDPFIVDTFYRIMKLETKDR